MNRRERRLQAKQAKKSGRPVKIQNPAGASPFGEVMRLYGAGDLRQAEILCSQVRLLHPNDPDGLFILAMIAQQTGRVDDALRLTEEAVALAPEFPEAHNLRGNALAAAGRVAEAAQAYRRAGQLDRNFADSYFRLGNMLVRMGDDAAALSAYESAVKAQAGHADAWLEMGVVLGRLDRIDDAVEACRQSVLARPDNALGYYNLGCMLERKGYIEHPRDVFEEAVRLKPDYAEAHYALASTWLRENRYDTAIACFRQGIEVRPDFARLHAGLAGALREMGYVDEARVSFEKALALEPDNAGWRVRAALTLPVIPQSVREIEDARQQFADNVQALRDEKIQLSDPFAEVGMTSFFLAYHELDDRPLQEAVAAMYLESCPSLAWVAPHCQKAPRPKKRLRLGICSAFMRGHTLGKLTLGTIKTLSRERFEVVLLRLPGPEDEMSKAIDEAADKIVQVPYELADARHTIAREELDVLFYPDTGMDSFTYFLGFSRLAAVQYTSWGHPDTTGIPNLDYFLSSEGMEPEGSEPCFSEQLVKLKDLTTYYYAPAPPEQDYTRADYDLPDDRRLYVCPQTLFKFHPDFDEVLGDLLRRDPEGILVLINDAFGGLLRDQLRKRFESAFADVSDQVRFVDKMPLDRFFGLVMLADAVLDVPTFSGGNSSIEAFSFGAPIVTWPGGYLRGRITLCCYLQMGVEDLIVDTAQEYISTVLRLASDKEFRQKMRARILENVPRLYENVSMVRELEDVLHTAHQARCEGRPKIQWAR